MVVTDTVYERAKALAVSYPFSISELITARSRMEFHLVDEVGVPPSEAPALADDFMALAAAVAQAANVKPAVVFEKLRVR